MPTLYRGLRHPVAQFRDEMERLLAGVFGQSAEGIWPSATRGQPPLNLWETSDALVAEMEVPGIAADQIDVSVIGGELSVQVQRQDPPEVGVTCHRRERPVGTTTRVLRLPADVDGNNVQAVIKDGVLTITLPKAEATKPRKIKVSSGE
ncbi:MAG: Hsp20/alpha crystallin family protein [Patescibacteria group bacterium]|nr:Hsp20/alpha crystallin family protein [Patescibacteria group bacterium]